ncbi:MAG TPA: hypothetical protein PKO09_17090 [Anaerolineae bacterium]|nr:hypothetical protein [Anaerolineae bacterium]
MDEEIERARARAVENEQITDMRVIRDRVFRRDLPFAVRVVLTAFVKGDEKTRERILRELESVQFGVGFFDLVFEWMAGTLRIKGKTDVADLHHQMESFVRSQRDAGKSEYSVEQLLPGYMAVIDHVVAIEMPDLETVEKALALIQESHAWRKNHLSRGPGA